MSVRATCTCSRVYGRDRFTPTEKLSEIEGDPDVVIPREVALEVMEAWLKGCSSHPSPVSVMLTLRVGGKN